MKDHDHDAAPDVTLDAIHRRSFLKRMAAAIALAGGGIGCERAPSGKILPYSSQPPEVTPGIPRPYATAFSLDGYATGVLVASREGRPVKVEGNPDHPASLGAAGRFEQATVLGVYDPDRAKSVDHHGMSSTWSEAAAALTKGTWAARHGRGLSIVMEPTGSLVVQDLLARLRGAYPEVDVRFFGGVPRTATWGGTRAAFGRALEPRYDLHQADVVVVIDDDPFARGPGWLRIARQFSDRRRSPRENMSRAYVVGTRVTPSAAAADHYLRCRRSEMGAALAAIFAAVAPEQAARVPALRGKLDAWRGRLAEHQKWIDAIARDLVLHRGRGVVIVGEAQPVEVHVLAHAIDAALGNIGHAKSFGESPLLEGGAPSHDIVPLARALDAGEVDTLVVLGTNLVYGSPAELDFAKLAKKARESFYLGQYRDETARALAWSAPEAHVLESWGDARAFDGTRSVVQPLIAPIYGGRTVAQALSALLGEADADAYAITRRSMRGALGAGTFERDWERALVRGLVEGSATPEVAATFRWNAVADAVARMPSPLLEGALEIAFDPDLRVYDGRFTNLAWLAELPEPVTTLTWGNAALLSPATAQRLGVENEDVVEVAAAGRSVLIPVLVSQGHADQTVTLTLGWGRDVDFAVARRHGVNANLLRSSPALFSAPVSILRTGEKRPLAIIQRAFGLHEREEEILPHVKLETLLHGGERVAPEPVQYPPALYANRPKGERQWGMVIDLNACTACSACVVACQAENNVPTVGFDGVRKGREMHWLHINVYHAGDPSSPSTFPQPMLCQHCEMAPCEYVCPVGATTHSADGLNEMTYNRCVGTRFCSNNCPYKIRRFNWFNYHQEETALVALVHNPDVTVRARGVMEKCTYCVQRIRRAEIRAAVDHRPMRDGDVVTACAEACPTQAIVFGDLADQESRIARLQKDERLYEVLHELGTVPRTRYLARVTNPNPELA